MTMNTTELAALLDRVASDIRTGKLAEFAVEWRAPDTVVGDLIDDAARSKRPEPTTDDLEFATSIEVDAITLRGKPGEISWLRVAWPAIRLGPNGIFYRVLRAVPGGADDVNG
jgi:hypothetical protein